MNECFTPEFLMETDHDIIADAVELNDECSKKNQDGTKRELPTAKKKQAPAKDKSML